MKKRVFILVIPLLFMTGCTCEYNLQIEDDTYKEQIKLKADNQDEVVEFNKKWEISTNKEGNIPGGDPSTTNTVVGDTYNYNLTNNILTFDYEFSQSKYRDSLAVSKCYNSFSVTDYQDSIIISTPSKTICFDNYPPLNSITINITTDKKVISDNADSVNGNTYTWRLVKDNSSSKAINLVMDNTDNSKSAPSSNSSTNNKEKKGKDYTIYIFFGILIVIVLVGYSIFNTISNNRNNMDD